MNLRRRRCTIRRHASDASGRPAPCRSPRCGGGTGLKGQVVTILRVLEEEDWYESLVEFETESGRKLRAVADDQFAPGRKAHLCLRTFSPGIVLTPLNVERVKDLEPTGEVSYFARGEIVDVCEDQAIVDCGGVLVADNYVIVADRNCIGRFVAFRITVLDAGRADK